MDQSGRFWDRIAERYSKQPIADEAAYQKKLQVTREYFKPDMEVLEIGCGTGSTAITHAPLVKHILAVDISSRMIEIAQGKAKAQNVKNVTFQCTTVDDFSVPDQTFDVVLALSILHLLGDREKVISKVHKMLKPGGTFVTSTACLGDMGMHFRIIAQLMKLSFGLLPVVKSFTAKELVESLGNAGFEIDYQWRPGKNKAIFVVANKAE